MPNARKSGDTVSITTDQRMGRGRCRSQRSGQETGEYCDAAAPDMLGARSKGA